MSFNFANEYESNHELVISKFWPGRAAWTEEMEESASHHFLIKYVICFAQLRAENVYKNARRPQETTGNHEKSEF